MLLHGLIILGEIYFVDWWDFFLWRKIVLQLGWLIISNFCLEKMFWEFLFEQWRIKEEGNVQIIFQVLQRVL